MLHSLSRSLIGLLWLSSLCTAAVTDSRQQPLQIATENDGPFDELFDAFVNQLLQIFHVPGLSIAVVDNGKTYSKGYGYASLEPLRNATGDTKYMTASTTKAFTAAAAALLVHDDDEYPNIKWTSRMNELIPEDFVLEENYATTHITLEDALSHRSGLPRHDWSYGMENDTVRSVVQRVRHLPLTREPRTKWQYCNIMYGVVTDMIETVTGKKLEAFLEKKFWRPLGMSSTSFSISEHDPNMATGYFWEPIHCRKREAACSEEYVIEPYANVLPTSGAGATVSTVNDYALWIHAWLQAVHGTNTSSPVTNRIFRDLLSPRSILPEEFAQSGRDISDFINPPLYGLAWITLKLFGRPLITHSGSITGFGTQLYMLPDDGYGIITMANTLSTSNDVGALIAAELLKRKTSANRTVVDEVHSVLRRLPREDLMPPLFASQNIDELLIPSTTNDEKAFQDPLGDLTGVYYNPGYGHINLTIADPSKTADEQLEFLFYPRMIPLKLRLSRKSNTAFSADLLWPHGLGDIPSGKGVVWERVGTTAAVIEDVLTTRNGKTLGIAIESEMVEAILHDWTHRWREALIWFEKV